MQVIFAVRVHAPPVLLTKFLLVPTLLYAPTYLKVVGLSSWGKLLSNECHFFLQVHFSLLQLALHVMHNGVIWQWCCWLVGPPHCCWWCLLHVRQPTVIATTWKTHMTLHWNSVVVDQLRVDVYAVSCLPDLVLLVTDLTHICFFKHHQRNHLINHRHVACFHALPLAIDYFYVG